MGKGKKINLVQGYTDGHEAGEKRGKDQEGKEGGKWTFCRE